jgi:hypothetical protein
MNNKSTNISEPVKPALGMSLCCATFLSRFYWCKIWKWHKWTCAAEKGIKPTQEQLNSNYGFWDYAKMYCERCGYVYKTSNELICKYKNLDSK